MSLNLNMHRITQMIDEMEVPMRVEHTLQSSRAADALAIVSALIAAAAFAYMAWAGWLK